MKELKDIRLLFVEDELLMQKSIEKILAKHVGEFKLAVNGEEGLKIHGEMKPDIVITDLDMPVMNGLQMISLIRQTDEKTPIIIITAFEDQAEVATGADFSLIKPILKKRLFELLEKCVEKLNSK
jgi:YesN/AraC family two-component response regulator